MNAARLPSGDRISLPFRPFAGRGAEVHPAPCRSQLQRRPSASNEMPRRSALNVNCMKGSVVAVYGLFAAADSAAAMRAWSNAAARVRRAVSTRMNSVPPAIWLRYQNRPSGSQVARTLPFETSGVVL